jgi:FKBP-type peptidyl-prolyl cis-trans isomerase 2
LAEIIRAAYTGKIKDTGEVFDTTDEAVARKAGIFSEHARYSPAAMVLGERRIIRGLEEELLKMSVGEEKTVEIPPERGYGQRRPELVKLMPLRTFRDSEVAPYPGMTVVLESGIPGRVQSVSGGRVRVDFNHELAGRTLVYDVKLIEKIAAMERKVEALFELAFPDVREAPAVEKRESGELEVRLPKACAKLEDLQRRKLAFIEDVKKIAGAAQVRITEDY